MPSAEHVVRRHKRHTDQAISAAFGRLSDDLRAYDTFRTLLHCVRNRAGRVLNAPIIGGDHPGVEALANLARYGRAYIRSLNDWQGSPESWRLVVSSLAQHLLCVYPVPRFLAASWYATDREYGERKREWFVAHGRGVRFRSLNLPITMTRKMEHAFLASPHHLAVEQAIRRAELLALGASEDVVHAVLATSLGADLEHGEFWRTVWHFLVANSATIDVAQVGPLIDFVQAIRHERVAVDTADGPILRDPPEPAFSMKGRTATSMLRLMRDWHRSLGKQRGGLAWTPSRLQPLRLEEAAQDPSRPPIVWQITELTTAAQLRAEGTALHHCVGSYARKGWRGISQIWSVRMSRGLYVKSMLTIEVDVKRRAIVQARGQYNRSAAGKPLQIMRQWAARERLRFAL